MDNRELRKLSRIQLLELLIQKSREAEALRTELTELRKQTDALANASALAEAANRLSSLMAENTPPCPVASTENSRERESVLLRAQTEAETLLAQTRAQCAEMVTAARIESQRWWENTARKMDAYYESHPGLREALADSVRTGEV